jgi:hypothetical protein
MKERNVVFAPHLGMALINYGSHCWRITTGEPCKVFPENAPHQYNLGSDLQAEKSVIEDKYPFHTIRQALNTRKEAWDKLEELRHPLIIATLAFDESLPDEFRREAIREANEHMRKSHVFAYIQQTLVTRAMAMFVCLKKSVFAEITGPFAVLAEQLGDLKEELV